MLCRVLIFVALASQLAACEINLFLGYGMPRTDACRDVSSLPGKPISTDCLDSLYN